MPTSHSVSEKLCLTCGLCCNGVIFADVQLQRGDDPNRLEAIGLRLVARRKPSGAGANISAVKSGTAYKFPQPCSAFDGCRCRIYEDRPKHCRAFDCALLKSVQAGQTKPASAIRTIEKARLRAQTVRELLRELGDANEHIALALRFRQTAKRLQKTACTAHTAGTFSELTLAAHNLNLVLSEKFYPGCG